MNSMEPSTGGRPAAPVRARLHLEYLDGLRGLTALYVVVFHLFVTQALSDRLSGWAGAATRWLRYGHFAVDVFIVLSGYCLMLPVARSADGRLPGGLGRFVVRRARRILPPLWAALGFTLVMMLLVRCAGARVRADDGSAFALGNLLAHVLVVHNWFPSYAYSIDLPMWTVADEWQIYFVFALLLLPLWRKTGLVVAVAAALALGELPRLLLPAHYNLDWARPWYVALFAFGMAAALVHTNDRPGETAAVRSTAWGAATAVLFAMIVAIECKWDSSRNEGHLWAEDLLVGATAASLLVYCLTARLQSPLVRGATPGNVLLGILESKIAMGLGAFSYSLYLIHMPVMWSVKFLIDRMHLGPYQEMAVRLTVAPLYILPFAFGFYWLFERPFVSTEMARRQRAELAPPQGDAAGPRAVAPEAESVLL